ncbi:hypothetical protein OK016_16300 [Vibrio chagasii]|nr:hypothetical protein [Vibrio chagasii]
MVSVRTSLAIVDFYQENQFVDENDGHGPNRLLWLWLRCDGRYLKWASVINWVKSKTTRTSQPGRESISFNASIDLMTSP